MQSHLIFSSQHVNSNEVGARTFAPILCYHSGRGFRGMGQLLLLIYMATPGRFPRISVRSSRKERGVDLHATFRNSFKLFAHNEWFAEQSNDSARRVRPFR